MFRLIIPLWLLFFFNIYTQTLTVSRQQTNIVKFLAQSTFSDFEGVTNAVEGSISWDSIYTKKSSIKLIVHLDSLDTGIGLRNSHMRNYLETDKYPLAVFNGKIIESGNAEDLEIPVKVKGNLEIHGVEKEFIIDGKIFNYGKLYKVQTDLKINLQDFKIDRPKFLFNKVDNEIEIKLNVYFNRKD